MKFWKPPFYTASTCYYRHQEKSITEQLDEGVRYFDINTCWNSMDGGAAWSCYQSAYGGEISDIIEQIDCWMNQHREEIIMLNFNADRHGNPDYVPMTGRAVIRQLNSMWRPTYERLHNGMLSINERPDLPIGFAIQQNARIYVTMPDDWAHGDHVTHMIPHSEVLSAWTGPHNGNNSNDVRRMLDDMNEDRCEEQAAGTYLRYDMFLSYGACKHELAELVRPFLVKGATRCHIGAAAVNRTVNVIYVDYADHSVVEAAREINLRNIALFGRKVERMCKCCDE